MGLHHNQIQPITKKSIAMNAQDVGDKHTDQPKVKHTSGYEDIKQRVMNNDNDIIENKHIAKQKNVQSVKKVIDIF